MNRITIAIDGFSSTGKSTVAKQLAKHLSYVYVDTGAMYRSVALYAMENGIIDEEHFNKEALVAQLPNIQIQFKFNETLGYAEVYLNGVHVEHKIRTIEVSSFVSQIATVSEVRKKLVEQQQKMGEEKGVVMDGRDIGTIVFPNAELKFFMVASAETRAERRYKELITRGDDVKYEAVLKNVTDRDYLDTTRIDSPLIKASDAIEIDNSLLSIEQQFDKVLELANSAIKDCN